MGPEVRETLVETGLATSNVRGRGPRTYVCRVTAGPRIGAQLTVGSRGVVLGSHPSCDLVLEDPKVSRRHVQLAATVEGLKIQDLGSSNGTYLDGVRVSEATKPVASGATASLRCGDTTLRVRPAPTSSIAPSRRDRFGGLVGESLAMREVFAVLELSAPTDVTVLVQGESGTGKELAARAIHDHSRRAEERFVVLDCGATHRDLIESQLFGHRRGAFTGAVVDRRGAFLEADRGTLFLDEVGELPLESQAKLLRALEARTITPLGADDAVLVDVRVIAATHRDLSAMVDQGRFRLDLHQRLAVVHVLIPPLRERPDDLISLIESFYAGRGVAPGPIDGENLARLKAHHWAGNIRELRNLLERSWVLSGALPFRSLDLWLDGDARPAVDVVDVELPFKEAKARVVEGFERRYLAALLRRYDDNLSRAADHAGINRRHLKKLLEAHGLRWT